MAKDVDTNAETVIEVNNLSKTFILPHERQNSLKGALMNLFSSKTYEKQQALKNIDFDIKKGEFFGIVGRNGSGKSTLLKLIAGIYTPTKGDIKVNGSLIPFIELGVGFNPELSGRENVFLNGALLGFTRKQMHGMYDEIVEFAELEKFMDQKLKNYSSGMQVRLAFSIAIRAKSDILLLDEVLAVGDAAFQLKCDNYFEELKSANQTVVLVSHNMNAIKRFCTRAILVKDGEIVESGSVQKVSDAYLLENIEQPKKVDKNKTKSNNSIKFSIKKEDDRTVKIGMDYKCDESRCFASLSLWKDGAYLGGINSEAGKPLKKSGKVEFTIDKSILNPGTYAVGGGVFKIDNISHQIAIVKGSDRSIFLIKGKEKRRAGAIKLEDTWVYEP